VKRRRHKHTELGDGKIEFSTQMVKIGIITLFGVISCTRLSRYDELQSIAGANRPKTCRKPLQKVTGPSSTTILQHEVVVMQSVASAEFIKVWIMLKGTKSIATEPGDTSGLHFPASVV